MVKIPSPLQKNNLLIKNFKIQIKTKGFSDIHDLSKGAQEIISESKIQSGQATLFVVGSTAGLTTVEYEPGLVQDLQELFEKLAPKDKYYHHEEAWHDGNGFSHVRASLLKPSLTIPVIGGRMTLGTWQQIVLIDFDNRPRTREIILQVMGE